MNEYVIWRDYENYTIQALVIESRLKNMEDYTNIIYNFPLHLLHVFYKTHY